MKTHLVLAGLPLALAAALWLAQGRPRSCPTETAAVSSAPSPAHPAAPPPTIVAKAPVATTTGARSDPFHWQQIESDDYRTYIQNLRAIGCPEATIRDIIVADVGALYRDRRQRVARVTITNYWQAGFGTSIPDSAELARLEEEEDSVLEVLLGRPQATAPVGPAKPEVPDLLGLEHLAEAKRVAVLETWRRYAAAQQSLLAITDERDLTDEEQQRFVALDLDVDNALAGLLTPEERLEFELRNSPSARYLHDALAGLQLAEPEFRQLFVARREFDERLASATTGEEALGARLAFDTVLQETLGTERTDLVEPGVSLETIPLPEGKEHP